MPKIFIARTCGLVARFQTVASTPVGLSAENDHNFVLQIESSKIVTFQFRRDNTVTGKHDTSSSIYLIRCVRRQNYVVCAVLKSVVAYLDGGRDNTCADRNLIVCRYVPLSPAGLSPSFAKRSAKYCAALSPPGWPVPRPSNSVELRVVVTSRIVSSLT